MKIKEREKLVALIVEGDCRRISIQGDGSWSGHDLTVGAGDMLARMGIKSARVAVISCRKLGRDGNLAEIGRRLDEIERGRGPVVNEDAVEKLEALRVGVAWWLSTYLEPEPRVIELVDKARHLLEEAVSWMEDVDGVKGGE